METGTRGFLVAGDPAFLEPFNSGKVAFRETISALKQTVSDNPAEVAVLASAESTINEWLAGVVTPMLDLRRQIGDAVTMDNMADLVGEARGKLYFGKFRELLAAFSAEEATLMVSWQAQSTRTQQVTKITIIIGLVVALIVGLIVAWLVGSNIGTAIRDLTQLMGRFAKGDVGIEISGQERGDEVGAMARATEVFKQNAIEVRVLNQQPEAASKEMAAMSEEREKAAQRGINLAKEKEKADAKSAAEREERRIHLGKSFGAVVEAAIDGEFSQRVKAEFSDQILNELPQNINQLFSVVDQGL